MEFEGEGGEDEPVLYIATTGTSIPRYGQQQTQAESPTSTNEKAAELSPTGDDSQCGVWPFAGRIEAVASIGEKIHETGGPFHPLFLIFFFLFPSFFPSPFLLNSAPGSVLKTSVRKVHSCSLLPKLGWLSSLPFGSPIACLSSFPPAGILHLLLHR